MTTSITNEGSLRCAMSFAGEHGIAKRGRLYRADSPLVRSAPPGWFVDPDTPEDEWPTEFDRSLETTIAEEAATREAERAAQLTRAQRNRVKLQAPAVLRAVRDVEDLARGRIVLKGSTALETDPVVADFPDAWKLV